MEFREARSLAQGHTAMLWAPRWGFTWLIPCRAYSGLTTLCDIKGNEGEERCSDLSKVTTQRAKIQPHICLNTISASFPLCLPGQEASHQKWAFRETWDRGGINSGPGPNSFLGPKCLLGVFHLWNQRSINTHWHTVAYTTLGWALFALNPQSGMLASVPGCRGLGLKHVRIQWFLLQFLSVMIQGYSWDYQPVIFICNLKNQNAFRCCKSMSHAPHPHCP